jgi:hypothetical protein
MDVPKRKNFRPRWLSVCAPVRLCSRSGSSPHALMDAEERVKRYRLAEMCAEKTASAVAFWIRIAEDKNMPLKWRFEAYDRLMDRAYGRAPLVVAIEEPSMAAQKKVIHEVRWLPPDPNDRSRVIEPEP